jgi:hypothetical protein
MSMYEQPEFREQRQRIDSFHAELADALSGELEPERAAALVTQLAVAAAQSLSGVCRKTHDDGEYADLRPVFDDDGLRYCCTGSPPHCTEVITQ